MGAMTEPPSPLVPPDCDVRGMTWMPLHGRVFGSRFYSLALRDPRAGLAALKLWWEAWQQCPAGSLPDDDFDLARMADFGSDARGWGKAKATALHGFVRCSDGRLYHPLICAEAMEAWDRRRKERDRKADQRARKTGQSADVPGLSRGTGAGHAAGQDADVRADRTGQDRTKKPSPSAQGARASGSRLSADWQPTEGDREYAEGLGLDCRRVAEDFRGYWVAKAGKDARKVDWSLTWQGWCRREADRAKQRPAGLFAVAAAKGVPRDAPPEAWAAYDGGNYEIWGAAEQVCQAARIPDPEWRGDWATLDGWLCDGLDLHAVILPAIKRVAGRPNYQPPSSLRFFDGAVRSRVAVA